MTYSVSKRATTKYYLIPIQSFSDIITNSSSETYIVDTPYTAKALEEVLEGIHKKYEGEEFYSGECCGIEVSDFKEYCREAYMWDEHDENGCLVVRVDYGYHAVDEFLTKNFKCIASDHERVKDSDGRIVKN